MKKFFIFVTFLFAATWFAALSVSEVKAQAVRFCPPPPPDWTLSTDGLSCIAPDGTKIPSTVTPPSSPTPTPPAPSPSGGTGTNGGALPECTDNYNSGQICLPRSPITNCTGIACSGSVVDLAGKIINILLYLAGIVAVIFVIIGGYKYMTAGGSEEAATKGRKTMTQAIIGLVIVILAYVIITAITNFLIK